MNRPVAAAGRLLNRGLARVGLQVVRPDWNKSLGAFLAVLFRDLEINVVLDVGAHHGEYAQMLRDSGYRGHIVSFEPVSDSFHQLEKACAHDPLWSARNVALGSEPREMTINVTKWSTAASFLPPSKYGKEERGTVVQATETVRVERLDSIFADCLPAISNPRVFLKVDTQGWDREVIRGAEQVVGSIPAIQVEMSVQPIYQGMPDYVEFISYLRGLGYEIATVAPVDRDAQLRLVEFDCVLIRPRG
ncbi:MAG TPA: FkbM family methyltransferase [Dehalococcoidia bacterium]|nr:FkbM family methyltransferase [Dehalococcoidia bacterium]